MPDEIVVPTDTQIYLTVVYDAEDDAFEVVELTYDYDNAESA